jgi:hypothetical protein
LDKVSTILHIAPNYGSKQRRPFRVCSIVHRGTNVNHQLRPVNPFQEARGNQRRVLPLRPLKQVGMLDGQIQRLRVTQSESDSDRRLDERQADGESPAAAPDLRRWSTISGGFAQADRKMGLTPELPGRLWWRLALRESRIITEEDLHLNGAAKSGVNLMQWRDLRASHTGDRPLRKPSRSLNQAQNRRETDQREYHFFRESPAIH